MEQKRSMNELRKGFLDFFESKGHLVLPSFSLVPKDDKSLILINAGMAPLKPYFTGLKTPPKKRLATCQKCVRTLDIDNVGKTSRHATFFEMLGNFSFGDYFKEEIIPWSWEYITEVLGLPKDRLYATVYEEDEEAFKIWAEKTDIGVDRIFRLGKADNFWEIGVGPCGPCSEIHYDYGQAGKITTREEFEEASEKDLIVEFWNLVFTQFDRDEDGNYNPLPNPNIDTGMGLERLATIMQGVNNIFETDAIRSIMTKVESILGKTYGQEESVDVSLRIITDHIKSGAMLISDGVIPSNEGRGYILRRLLRRAARHGRLLGHAKPFLSELVPVVVAEYGEAYENLKEKQEYISKIMALEEEKFNQTIDTGMERLEGYVAENEGEIFSGDHAFKLYDTYGFPLELTEEIVQEKGLKVDYEAFQNAMKHQKEMARSARGSSNYLGNELTVFDSLRVEEPYEFTGYSEDSSQGEILLLADENGETETLEEGSKGFVILDRAPLYAEMGGQVGDLGTIQGENFSLRVVDTKKNRSGATLALVEVESGTASRSPVNTSIENNYRNNIRKNHTATHLLHKALKLVLGDHVNQAGSLVDSDKLRFDFNHYEAMKPEEIRRVEDLVNDMILKAEPVVTDIMTMDEAREAGAMALFEAKYGEKVRVVSAGTSSKELCGGTHVFNTGEIGLFKILSETGVAAGIRRIEAITGVNTLVYLREEIQRLDEVAKVLKTTPAEAAKRALILQQDLKNKDKEIQKARESAGKDVLGEIMGSKQEVAGIAVVAGVADDLDNAALRNLTEKALDRLQSGVAAVASKSEDKVSFCVMVSKDLAGKRAHAGKLIGEIAKVADGKGGGRPDMAQAGGKLPEKAEEAVKKVFELLVD